MARDGSRGPAEDAGGTSGWAELFSVGAGGRGRATPGVVGTRAVARAPGAYLRPLGKACSVQALFAPQQDS